MPSALRGSSGPAVFGLPHLGSRDFQKVRAANNMFFGAVKVIRRCLRLNVCGYLENPRSSRLWLLPQIQCLLQDHRVSLIHTELCRYGTHNGENPHPYLYGVYRDLNFSGAQATYVCAHIANTFSSPALLVGASFLSMHKLILQVLRMPSCRRSLPLPRLPGSAMPKMEVLEGKFRPTASWAVRLSFERMKLQATGLSLLSYRLTRMSVHKQCVCKLSCPSQHPKACVSFSVKLLEDASFCNRVL